jgi:hypothetical protein
MKNIFNGPSAGILTIGLIFLIVGLVHQEFAVNFESGFFNLGIIFTLSGAVSWVITRKYPHQP